MLTKADSSVVGAGYEQPFKTNFTWLFDVAPVSAASSSDISFCDDCKSNIGWAVLNFVFCSSLVLVLSYLFLDDKVALWLSSFWGPSFKEGAQSGLVLSYKSALLPETETICLCEHLLSLESYKSLFINIHIYIM